MTAALIVPTSSPPTPPIEIHPWITEARSAFTTQGLLRRADASGFPRVINKKGHYLGCQIRSSKFSWGEG